MTINRKNMNALAGGLLLVGLGVFLLVVNLYQLDIDWFLSFKLLFPAVFVWIGSLKLWRRYTWPLEKILERPGKAGLLSGLFWLSLGLVLALAVFSVVDFFRIVGVYWPVILLLFGAGKIIDFFRMKEISRSRFAEIVGIIFIAFFGLSCFKIHQLNLLVLEHDPFWERIPQLIGIEEIMEPLVEHDLTVEFDLEGVSEIRVSNAFGDVSIEGSSGDSGKGLAKVSASLRAKDQTRAQAVLNQLEIEPRREGDTLVVTTNRDDLNPRKNRLGTSLDLQIPEHLKIRVANEFGDVRVSKLKNDCAVSVRKGTVKVSFLEGNLEVKSDSEAIDLESITGNVSVDSKFSEVNLKDIGGNASVTTSHKPVSAFGVKGNLKIENRHDDIEAQNIEGSVDINNPGGEVKISQVLGEALIVNSRGDVTISGLGGPLELSAAYGDVFLADLEGSVNIKARHADIQGARIAANLTVRGENSAVELEELGGSLLIETSQEPVFISGVSGPVNIQNDLGEVELVLTEGPTSDVRIQSRQGDLSVEMPPDASFRLDARARNGKILSDFGNPPEQDVRGDAAFETVVGDGGTRIDLLTSGSVIKIRRSQ